MRARDFARGLQFEIVANLFVVMLAGLAIVATVMAGLAARTVERSAVEQLRTQAWNLERMRVVGSLRLGDLAVLARTLPQTSSGARWTVLDEQGREVNSAPLSAETRSSMAPLLAASTRSGLPTQGGGLLISDLVLVAPLHAGGAPGTLVGIVPQQELYLRLSPLLRSGAWVLLTAATVFVAFGAYLLRWRIVRPVQALQLATRRVADGDLDARTEALGSDELADLARGFNDMAESLARERRALLRAQESLSRSQRLATVGQLAAGVAHEVGNPVAAILGYAEVLLRNRELVEPARETSERIRAEALRVRTLVRELLDLARSERAEMELREPAALIERAAARLRPQPMVETLDLRVEIAADLPRVRTDGRRVEQILVNLVENAAHALAGCDGARIEIRAQLSHNAAPLPSRRHSDPPAGDFNAARGRDSVAISVHDNGPGIDTEDQPHVFDPFFTTKDQGKGTGLGLWNAHRLAELVGGRLELESAPGRTVFSLMLPIADRQDDPGECHGPAAHPDHR